MSMALNFSPLLRDAARWRGLRVGLYGGSFNPGHEGHLHVALEALKRLPLDAVWFLVSPGNPFKDMDPDMAAFGQRLESAQELADQHPRLFASDIEESIGSRYSAQTVQRLTEGLPDTRFLWMMGADNMQHFHRWFKCEALVETLPIAIFDRPLYSIPGLVSRFAARYRHSRVAAHRIFNTATPSWTFVTMPRHPASATAIRRQIGLDWAGSEDESWT